MRTFASNSAVSVRTSGQPAAAADAHLSEVLAGLSYALDLTEGQREGHAVRSCLIGMRIGEIIGLDDVERSSLFYALLMKDLGCSSNAARFAALFGADDQDVKAAIKTINWTRALESFRFVARNVAPGAFWLTRAWRTMAVLSKGPKGAREVVRTRCERGADIAKLLGLTDGTVKAIRAIDEHWNGGGQPYGLKGHEIPAFARIVGLAQTVEVFWSTYGLRTAFDMAAARRGRWFEPALVDALCTLKSDAAFWQSLAEGDSMAQVSLVEPKARVLSVSEPRLDVVAEAFARVIDAKSPWTFRHSNGVADMAVRIGGKLGLAESDLNDLRRAALLHDIGKLGVSNLILDKPGKLDADEIEAMREHPAHTRAILERVGCFRPIASVAAAHHERLDGHGYHLGLDAHQLPLQARILCAADICDALLASRPYRAGLPVDRVLEIMKREVGTAVDPDCYAALDDVLHGTAVPTVSEAPTVHAVPALAEDYVQAA